MKAKILVSIFFCLFALSSCEKDKGTITTSGSASATINGISWVANSVVGGKVDDSTISFIAKIQKLDEYNEPYPYDNLGFKIRRNNNKQSLRKFSIIPYVHFYTSIEQGHSSNERFEVLESDTANNWVQITEESGDYKEIKGKFSLTLIKTDVGIDPNRYPDTLRIRDGVFSVTLD